MNTEEYLNKALAPADIEASLKTLAPWYLDRTCGKLRLDLTFDNFRQAFGFLAQVAFVAESCNHHPEIENVYNRVTLYLTTHDAGGITEKDTDIAAQILGLRDRL